MLPDRYHFLTAEPHLIHFWAEQGIYAYDPQGSGPTYTIDTPPPTVSGELHLGHCFSYTQTDVIARFHRMLGERVLYPMGFDDNGLPTERFVEKTLKRKATEMEPVEFLRACREITEQAEDRFAALWQRLGLSVDWRYRYSSSSPEAQRISQWSFLELYRQGRIYTQQAPVLWCPECRTAIAQAEVDDLTDTTRFTTIAFSLADGATLPIATTRPELLPACVAIFIHPQDSRYAHLVGRTASIASAGFSPQEQITVPLLADERVDPQKGTGAVMCCTFGDSTDIFWWRTHNLPLRQAIGRDGRMTELAGPLAGISIKQARERILAWLAAEGLILHQEQIEHTLGTHERCGTPVEYLHTRQWFVRVLDQKERLLELGRSLRWQPAHMQTRYEHWVENLQWDWCISRQRYWGIPFPAWTCRACGTLKLARPEQLPLDPRQVLPDEPCDCGALDFEPERDVMDTWATSSCSPLLIGRLLDDPDWFARHYPASLRPQAHDIIRTWAFYTLVKALYHTGRAPWKEIMISGFALAEKSVKFSKSKGNSRYEPGHLIEQESADALRYWATGIRTGLDTFYNQASVATGRRLVTKLWNAARFAQRHISDLTRDEIAHRPALLLPVDRWLLSRLAQTVEVATAELRKNEYATARAEIERFFWNDLCDNYLELIKGRLYQADGAERLAARWTLYQALLAVLKLFAPYLPFVTEQIYQGLFRERSGDVSLHRASWPLEWLEWHDPEAEAVGSALLELLQQVRRYKAAHGLSLAAELACLRIRVRPALQPALQATLTDIQSATRAREVQFEAQAGEPLTISIQ
ncbi:valyl-tRNA synthetase [Thermosporothrix hazakensis]|jgi:valyl-tRNA synthetase|uniref:Valine--tRNA ligase n=1 Tax=Thermosporothrix hazakensis TaxID=644383 RepID=A0A326U1K3_THEHA|nr:valine--tRNA ligase [Thermosporothrix hazakensis]PZW24845.1 valyl-tRNA synthetase [Thermosporothrix hazakensis]GCE46465.1 valine--tRNA ligase [Thermosporothrix hazakensis]